MKIRHALLAALTIMLLTIGNVWAARGGDPGANACAPGQDGSGCGLGELFPAPEIDATSGTSAIALLTGVLLLAAERSRYRRP